MKIHSSFVRRIRQATSGQDLLPLVQAAIELEHATIPPYLCGYFTLKGDTNKEVANIIRSVVVEEMLHMTIASNLLLALGGKPEINSPQFVPKYPGELPMGIGDHLDVHLRKCSIEQVRDVFMAIEAPEDRISIPTEPSARAMFMAAESPTEFDTIGAFYDFLAEKIKELGDGVFVGDPKNQVVATQWFTDPDEMFAITDVASALKAIEVIVDQGEGTHTDPFDESGNPAHFYRFEEIVEGYKLIRTGDPEKPYVFGGDPVPFDPSDVWEMDENPAISKYKPGSRSRRLAEQFGYSYTKLLNALHEAFNGTPESLDHAMGQMYELRLVAQQVLETPAEWADPTVTIKAQTGLSFEYVTINR